MKIALNEKQYDLLLSNLPDDQEISEEDVPSSTSTSSTSTSSSTTASVPTNNVDAKGVSSSGEKKGYPTVSKWSDLVGTKLTRGPGNQIANTKWSDIVGSLVSRGPANQLSEQNLLTPKKNEPLNLNNFKLEGPYIFSKEGKMTQIPNPFNVNKGEKVTIAFYITNKGNNEVKITNLKPEEKNDFRLPTESLENLKTYSTIIKPQSYSVISYDISGKEDGKMLPTTLFLSVLLEKKEATFVTSINPLSGDNLRINLPSVVVNVPYPKIEKGNLFGNHTVNMILQIGTIFIPVVGIFISSGIGFMDAKQYYDEGDKKTAGLVAFLTLLPGIGKIVNKIPLVKTLNKNVAEILSKKLLNNTPLSTIENQIVKGIADNQNMVKLEINNKIKNMAATASLSSKVGTGSKKALNFIGKNGLILGGYYGAAKGYEKMYNSFNGKELNSQDFIKQNNKTIYTTNDLIFVNGEWVLK